MARSVALGFVLALSQLAQAQEVTALAFSPDGSILIHTGLHGRLECVDGVTNQDIWHTEAHYGGVFGMALSPKGTHFATCGADRKVKLWKLVARPKPSAQEIRTLARQDEEVVALAFSPDGRTLAAGGRYSSKHTSIRLWEVDTGKQLSNSHWDGGGITSLVFSADGKVLAWTGTQRVVTGLRVTFEDDKIHLWNLTNFNLSKHLPHRAHQTAFTPDGRFLVSVGHYLKNTGVQTLPESDCDITIWDMMRGHAVFQHKEFQRTMALSRDGKWLATAFGNGLNANGIATYDKSTTKGVQLWEMASGKPVLWQRLDHNEQAVVALSPNGTRLAVGHKAGNVTLHKLVPEEWQPGPRLESVKLPELWHILAGEDAPLAFEAIGLFVESRDETVSFLKERLRPAFSPDPTKVRKLIKDLDDANFKVRDAANRELGRLGSTAEGEIRRALQEKPSLETERRIRTLLSRLSSRPTSPEELRQSRAIVVLGRIGTKEARHHLESLAKGEASAWLTQEAQSCLSDLTRR